MVRISKALFFVLFSLLFTAALPAQTEHFLVTEEAASVFASPPSVVSLPLLPDVGLKIIPPPEVDKLHNRMPLKELQATTSKEDACVSCSRTALTASEEIHMAYRIDAWQLYLPQAIPASRPASRILNSFYVKPVNESDKVRQMWKEAFGMDVWLPYYNVKKVEKWAKEKVSFKIFKMKCKPRFEKGSFTYTCGRTF